MNRIPSREQVERLRQRYPTGTRIVLHSMDDAQEMCIRDRSRYIAKNLVAAGLCSRCQVTLAYAIGKAEPVMVEVDTFGTGAICADDCMADAVRLVFGLTPSEIIAQLDLLTPRYTQTAAYGHFGKPELPWERTDQAKILRATVI